LNRRSNSTVLVVDHPHPSADSYQRLLQQDTRFSCQILTERYEDDIISLCQFQSIDAILIESHFPNLEGFELLAQLQTQLGEDCPPIIVIDQNDVNLAKRALKAGAADYLVREQITAETLIEALESLPPNGRGVEEETESHEQQGSLAALRDSEAEIALDLRDTQLLRDLGARLITEGDIQTLYEEIMAVAIALMEADAGTIQILDEATQELMLLATQGFEPAVTEYFSLVNAGSNTSCGRALVTGDRVSIDFDVPESEDLDGSLGMLLEAGYRSAQSTPLITRSGKAIGMVSTHWRKPHRPRDRELRFLDLLARQAADLIEQRQAQTALRKSEQEYRTLFEAVDEGICLFERLPLRPDGLRDYRYIAMNPAMQAMFGIPDLSGQSIRDNFPDEVEDWYDDYDRVLETGQSIGFERESEPQGIMLEMFVTRVEDGSGKRLLAVMQDITERKRAEEQLRRVAEIDAFRLKLSDALRSLADPVEIEETATRITLDYFGADRCYYCEIEEDKAIIRRDAVQGDLPTVAGEYPLSHFALLQAVIEAGHPFVVQDVRTTDTVDEDLRQLCIQLQVISYIDVPVIKNGKAVGVLCLVQSTPRDWSDLEVELAIETADRTWAAVERARAEAALRESEQRLSAIFAQAAVGLSEISLEGRFRRVNDALCRLMAQSRSEMLSTSVAEVTYPDDLPSTLKAFEELFEKEDPVSLDKRYVRPDGTTVWANSILTPLRDDQGQPYRVLVVTIDLSDRKRAEAALRRSEQKYRSLFENINDGFCIMEMLYDDDGNPRDCLILEVNPSFAKHNGLVNAEGKTAKEFDPNLESKWLEKYHQVIVTGQATRFEIYNAQYDIWFDVKAFPYGSPADHQFAVVFSNINARKQAEANRLQLIEEHAARLEEQQRAQALVALDEAKTRFFSNISHEFRTPLTLLLAPLEDALQDATHPLPPSHRERLELAHRNSLRLLKLVNTLLDFSRVEAGRIQAHYEPTDLGTYTAQLASMFRAAVENAGLQLIVDCPPLPEPIYVDRELWEKIVSNLLSNALKFTFTGAIAVSLKAVKNQVELVVLDTGIGIPEDELSHIFERFYQSQGQQGRSSEGSGIGLSLVQELVRLQGGRIEVRSQVEQGTTFRVIIPSTTDHLPPEQIQEQETPTPTGSVARAFVTEAQHWVSVDSTPALASPKGERERILIVDDNVDMLSYLQGLLSQHYDVDTAADGLAALRQIHAFEDNSTPYDLVLTDIMMPQMDGMELLHSLRTDPHISGIPIILLSARAGEEAQVEGLEARADDYLTKPFSAQELLARVHTHLELVKMRREATYREQVMAELQKLNETLEDRVQERTARLEALNQELEAFSSAVSHDLQTPLRYISNFAERLQSKLNLAELDSSSQQYLSIIVEAAEQCREMINNLLEFSRMGQTQLHFTQVPMNQLVQQVREQLEPDLAGRVVHWLIEPLPSVWGDPNLLRLVCQNLLANAVKYTENRTQAEVRIGSVEGDQEITFFVKDNGVGFDPKYHDRLFSLFQRLHPQEQFAGTGVGLANVRRIIHRHGGRIWAEGAVDQGATFYFSLPKQPE
jgi:PAS domain S-box-containing protein